MSDKNQKNNNMSDQGFLFLAACLFVGVGWSKFKMPMLMFYYKWRFLVALLITLAIYALFLKLKKMFLKWTAAGSIEKDVLAYNPDEDSVYAGMTEKGKNVYIKLAFRRMHVQIVGTTNAGKTESVIIPWTIDDIKKGRGCIIIDGKSDRSLLDKIYAYAKKHGRLQDVKILSLCNVDISSTFNPLEGGSSLEIAERVFNALNFENEYFKSIQYDAFLHSLLLLEAVKIKATPYRVLELLRSDSQMSHLIKSVTDPELCLWVAEFCKLSKSEREQRTSGLVSQLQSFVVGETGLIFNSERSEINLERALENGEIIYCQLPALKIPTLGKATGKMILQCLQSAVASRHLGAAKSQKFFSVYLDDFTEYLTPSFVTLLNKSRSANVGIVFAHQALGDLSALGDGVKNSILTNSNLKIFMRTNEPESAEYFSSVIGTSLTSKVTERQKSGFIGSTKTGDGSVRDAEEFKFHPNVFKQELGVGEAVVVLPHGKGSLPVRMKFRKSFDLDIPVIPTLFKSNPVGLPPIPTVEEIKQGLDPALNLANPSKTSEESTAESILKASTLTKEAS
ncbi:MAG TPA: type IV secretory system conjugative DNA transfer family protein [Pseudobdellovibrionaceae bacterium]|jgi:type IV secretory pathway TraG/TraD family ATPase VirD4